MTTNKVLVLLTTVALTIVASSCGESAAQGPDSDQRMERIRMLEQHGLSDEAKSLLIETIFSGEPPARRAEALYLLGTIAFSERRVDDAADTWRRLVDEHPGSEHAALVVEDLDELSESIGDLASTAVDSARAALYLRHADFWSDGRDTRFALDSSWIPQVEAAVKWYDRVISEFPRTTAARRAYERKMWTLIGWEEPGRYGQSHGLDESFDDYIGALVETFTAFQRDFPDASTLQAFRFQIAQAYWRAGAGGALADMWAEAQQWLQLIIQVDDSEDTFYSDLARRRLEAAYGR